MKVIKAIIIILLVSLYLLDIKKGYNDTSSFCSHLMFTFCHVNVWHLMCNILALLCIKGRLYLIPAFFVNIISSFLVMLPELTYGFSGVLFAIIGIKYGAYFMSLRNACILEFDFDAFDRNLKRFFFYTLLPLGLTVVIPNINWQIHAVTLVLGLSYGMMYQFIKQTNYASS